MEKLEMLQAKRDEILDKISRHNREVAKLREELDNIQYQIGIQRLLKEREDLLEEESVKEDVEWILVAQEDIDRSNEKAINARRPDPCACGESRLRNMRRS